jgi:hypothetical protein
MMSMPIPKCPYVGLEPYEEKYRDFFFGRERDQRIISSNLQAARLTILYGESGVGKSSILMAGVAPRLRAERRTAVVVYREWQRPSFLEDLKRECFQAVQDASGKSLDIAVDQPLDDLLEAAIPGGV